MKIFDLRCDNRNNPLGIDCKPLLLSFKAQGSLRNVTIKIGLQPGGADFILPLDDGARSCQFIPKQHAAVYYWRVEAKGEAGVVRSEEASFETGISDAMWQGCYIGLPVITPAAFYVRRLFSINEKPIRARGYLATEGFSELWCNGEKLTQFLLEPTNSDYQKHLYYRTFDMTDILRQGKNAVGVWLNNGWSAHGKFLFQLNMEYDDGSSETLYSEPGTWLFTYSPITLATIYSGEQYNSVYERPYWCLPTDEFETALQHGGAAGLYSGFQMEKPEDYQGRMLDFKNKYYNAVELPAPRGEKKAMSLEPIRPVMEITPVSFTRINETIVVYDFGRNFSGVCRLTCQGPKGAKIVLEHSELLDENGMPNMVYLKAAEPNYPHPMQTDVYICKGEGTETFTPRFTYHGFRFVAVHNLPCEPTLHTLTGLFIHSDVPERGTFAAGHDMINWLQQAIRATEVSNLYGIPTDCPQRAERQGWLNDMTARSEGAVYNLDLRLLYTKWLQDIADTQDPVSGAIGDTAPFRRGNFPADTVVTSYLLVPYYLYLHYGDIRPLKKHFAGLCGWADYLLRNSDKGIGYYSLYGDWAAPDEGCYMPGSPVSYVTPGNYMSACFNYFNCKLLAEMAGWLGDNEKQSHYAALAQQVGGEINRVFYNPATAQYATGSQACNVFALYLGFVPKQDIPRVVENIKQDIIAHDYHLTTGNLCTKYLLEMLTEYGEGELALRLIEQTTYPSWGFMREMGATTIWERWEYATGMAMNSHSHPMYGSITAWFFKYLAGLSPLAPGFAEVKVRPFALEGLPWVKATLQTDRGEVVSSWERTPEGVQYTISLPEGVPALVELPANAMVLSGKVKEQAAPGTYLQTGAAIYRA